MKSPIENRKTVLRLPLILCLAAALAALVMGGAAPGEDAFAAFQAARSLAAGHSDAALVGHPLFIAPLVVAGRLGWPIPAAGVVLSAAGWLAAIAAVYWIGLHFERPALAVVAAAALTLEPGLYALVGQDALFVMGWLWCALALAVSGRWPTAMAMLLLLLASTAYQAYFSLDVSRLAYYAILLPGLALLAGFALDRFIGLAGRLPLAQADRRILSMTMVAVALSGLIYTRLIFYFPLSTFYFLPFISHLPLWSQAGLWLRDNTPPEAVVWSDAPGALAYFSERAIASPQSVTRYSLLVTRFSPPDYVVSVNSLAWAERIHQAWFREHCQRVHAIANPYDSLAPLTIWRCQPAPYDAGQILDVGARLGNADGEKIELVNYRLDSTQLVPGQARYLTLTWRALEPLARPLSVQVRLYSEADARVWAQVDRSAPAGVKTTLWPADRLMADRYTLPLPADLPAGVYALAVRVYVGDEVGRVVPLADGEQELTLARLTRDEP